MLEFRCKHLKTVKTKSFVRIEFLTFDEIPENELMLINKMPGYLMFQEDKFSAEQEAIMKDKKYGMNEKGMRPSQLMRGTLLDVWIKHYSDQDKEEFYRMAIEKMITNLKKQYGV
jgi:hypothetical protein